MKAQTTVRMSDATRAKLDRLTTVHGTQTEVIALAIDRMYREEKGKGKTMETLLDDDEMADYIKDPAVLALARDADDWEAMQNAVDDWCADNGRTWTHYGAYGAGDSRWIIARN